MSDHLRIDADLGRLAEVRRFVREEAEAVHATVECLDDLVQAIDEASTNGTQLQSLDLSALELSLTQNAR